MDEGIPRVRADPRPLPISSLLVGLSAGTEIYALVMCGALARIRLMVDALRCIKFAQVARLVLAALQVD